MIHIETLKSLHKLTFILVIVGGLNWGLVGIADLNLINLIFGSLPSLETLIYLLVGIAALNEAIIHGSLCKACEPLSAKKKN